MVVRTVGARIARNSAQAWRDIDLFATGGIRLDESGADGKPRSWIMIAPTGTFEHDRYGTLDFTRAKLAEMKANFDQRVRHIDIALDVDHDQGAATGWLERLEFRSAHNDQPAGMWGLVRWTPYGAKLLQEEQYRYFSPEFGDWKDPESGTVYHNVLMGGALTNRPFLKTMGDVHLSEAQRVARDVRLLHDAVAEAVSRIALMEISNRSWASVNKSKLPRSCFLVPGDPDDKESWKLPVYEGAGPLDASGHYTRRGPLNINAVRAALAALGGAHTGTPMAGVPAGVKARLERWIQRYGSGGSGGSASKAASERAGAPERMARTSGKDGWEQVATRKLKDQRNAELANQDELDELDLEEEGEENAYQFGDGTDSGNMDADNGSYDEDGGGDSEDEADGGADDGEEEDGGFDAKADRHGPMTTKGHMHGKYAEHSHSGDGDHSDAPMKMGRKMSERGGDGREQKMTLAERRMFAELKALREEHARTAYQLYETKVGTQLDEWARGKSFTYKAGMRDGKPVMRTARIGFSKLFADRYKAFMLSEGFKLSERQRSAFDAVIEAALAASVDLTARGNSFDQESRRTVRAGEKPGGPTDSDKLQAMAERIALAEEGKALDGLDYAKQMALYERAAREIGYR